MLTITCSHCNAGLAECPLDHQGRAMPHALFNVATEQLPSGDTVGKGVGVENGHAMFTTPDGQHVPLCVADRLPVRAK
jgi:hypothetical protein